MVNTEEKQELLSVSEAAKIKGVSRPTIYSWIETRKINTAQTTGGRTGIKKDEKFESIVAQGIKNQDFLYSEISELQNAVETIQKEIENLKGTKSHKIEGCYHNVVAKPYFEGEGKGKFRGECNKCGAVGDYSNEPCEAINDFIQKVIYGQESYLDTKK